MKVSIITVVYNNACVIKTAIESVLSQTYPKIEYIIIDGKSTEGTVEIIRAYGDKISKFISEPDNGMYDAMNKGIKLATGDIIGILNSDDIYKTNDAIEQVVDVFQRQNVQSVFADLVYVRSENLDKVVRYYDSGYFCPDRFAYGWMPAHPTFFVKKEVYEKYGYFKTDYQIAADFELTARFLKKYGITYAYLPKVLVKMRTGGVSNSLKSFYINSMEQLRACKENGISTNIFKILSKYPTKMLGFTCKKFAGALPKELT